MERLEVSVFTVPTDEPESDGTHSWDATTLVAVEATAGGRTGLGFSYATPACGRLIHDVLEEAVVGRDAMDVPAAWEGMVRAIRNLGRPGLSSMAIAAVDTALWDLKARLVGCSLVSLLGAVRREVPVYGSSVFTSDDERRMARRIETWVHEWGIPRVKIKVGTRWGADTERDLDRVRTVRKLAGDEVELMVDANGAYGVKQAIGLSSELAAQGVTWFEEPVSSDDLEGLRRVREASRLEVTAGEYGYDVAYFNRMIRAGAVDVLQADVSRCAGITEWLRVAALSAVHGLDLSAHTAQSLHAQPACAVPNLRHVEYFHDHERVDRILLDGVLEPQGGMLRPDLSRRGTGLELKRSDAERYAV